MVQLKRWADYMCMCAFCLPAALSASDFYYWIAGISGSFWCELLPKCEKKM
jgi:hypothetical protein